MTRATLVALSLLICLQDRCRRTLPCRPHFARPPCLRPFLLGIVTARPFLLVIADSPDWDEPLPLLCSKAFFSFSTLSLHVICDSGKIRLVISFPSRHTYLTKFPLSLFSPLCSCLDLHLNNQRKVIKQGQVVSELETVCLLCLLASLVLWSTEIRSAKNSAGL